jgi:CHRD domain
MRRAVFLLTTAAALAAMLAFAGPALAQTDAQTDADALAEAAQAQATDALAGAALAQTDADDSLPTNDNPPVTVLQTELSGEEEVPGPGDPDGSGSATVIVIPPETICYVLTAEGIEPATAAHIHEGERGVAGDVVVPLNAPTFGASGGCTQADPELVSDIQENPDDYYVNVHNAEYPAGAIRGQL